MKTGIIILLLFLVAMWCSGLDIDYSFGILSLEKPSSDITLERIGCIHRNSQGVELVFELNNTSAKPVTAIAVLPVIKIIPVSYILDRYSINDEDAPFLTAIYGDTIFSQPYYLDPKLLTEKRASLAIKKVLKTKTGSEDVSPDFFFSITLFRDKDLCSVQSVSAASELVREGDSYFFRIVYDLKYSLNFKKAGTSHIIIDTLLGYCNMSSYTESMNLDLSGLKAWKQGTREIVFICDKGIYNTLPPAFVSEGELCGITVYRAKTVKPETGGSISSSCYIEAGMGEYNEGITLPDIFSLEEGKVPEKPAQDFVQVLEASSFLKEKTDVYTKTEIFRNAGFGPLALFDGLEETAYCEGVKGDGTGEWVKFRLVSPVFGLSIANGFARLRFSLPDENESSAVQGVSKATYEKMKQYRNLYWKNSRVSKIEFVSDDKKTRKTVFLQDEIDFKSIDPFIYLPAGVYTLFIRDIYRGTQYQDTCLAEIEFFPATLAGTDAFRDEFIRLLLDRMSIPIDKIQ